jgi:hypothetical protein
MKLIFSFSSFYKTIDSVVDNDMIDRNKLINLIDILTLKDTFSGHLPFSQLQILLFCCLSLSLLIFITAPTYRAAYVHFPYELNEMKQKGSYFL